MSFENAMGWEQMNHSNIVAFRICYFNATVKNKVLFLLLFVKFLKIRGKGTLEIKTLVRLFILRVLMIADAALSEIR